MSQVVHPGIKRQVEIDLRLMKAGSWLLHCLPGLKWLSLCEIVEEFDKLMSKQVQHSICRLCVWLSWGQMCVVQCVRNSSCHFVSD